jgi:hypothetical protein
VLALDSRAMATPPAPGSDVTVTLDAAGALVA